MIIQNIIKSIRLYQFHKNIIIFAPLFFANQLFNLEKVLLVLIAFIIFILASGAIYIINDIKDKNRDILHPIKKDRPIASGSLRITYAIVIVIVLSILVFFISYRALRPDFFYIILSYYLLMLFYTLSGRDMAIIDVLVVSCGYVLRVLAGVVVISVEISPWLVICTFFAANILLLGKRYSEIEIIDRMKAMEYRAVFKVYDENLLQQFLNINYSCAILSYCLYTISGRTIEVHHTKYLYLTIPFVIYGIIRFQYLLKNTRLLKEPELFFLKDKYSLANIILWLLSFYIISRF
ncbi:MAG: UbiA prenyltransferase family protein [Candidatus Hydrogenedentota bacterium]